MLKPFGQYAHSISELVNTGSVKAEDVLSFYLDRLTKLAPKLNSHIFYDAKKVAAAAEKQIDYVNDSRKRGKRLKLAGVPIAVKDNILTVDFPTTAASRILANFTSIYDATVVRRLKEEGAFVLGKTNLDEFAMGSSNENSAFGGCKNPWDLNRVPGGSSGGSVAAVAADISPVSLGSDTGGSIRQPASFCGTVGLKPTYGRISRYGLIAFGSSLDQIGPFSRTVKDSALLFDVMSGYDKLDSTSVNRPQENVSDALAKAPKNLAGMKIGVIKEFDQDGIEPDVKKAFAAAVNQLESLGAKIVEVSIPNIGYSIATYYILATAEASSNLARFDGVRYGLRVSDKDTRLEDLYLQTRSQGFGREVKQRIMLGTFVLSSGYYDAYYSKANAIRDLLTSDFAKAFSQVDLIVSPTSPTTAFAFNAKQDSLSMYLCDVFTIAANLTGVPAMSIPCGYDQKGLPVGMQIIAPHFKEDQLFKAAHIYEESTKWHHEHPKL
ncbi:MAG: Asp-tRNA(Asn)/Glu-tRNA(Gln) amidotransferase subunit GatA [Oligoflexales bacterium]